MLFELIERSINNDGDDDDDKAGTCVYSCNYWHHADKIDNLSGMFVQLASILFHSISSKLPAIV